MVDPKAGKFINSLVKSLQMLCHGYMDFKDNIEIIGHIYLRIDNSQKFDYIVNEQVSKQGDDSTFFQSNSYHSLPPSKTGRERERSASGRSDDDPVTANHHRLEDTALSGSRVQIDLSGPVPVTRNSEASPDCFFNAATIASEIRRRSHSRDSQSLAHPLDDDHHRALGSVGQQDHAHNHSNVTGARDHEQLERPASNSADRTDANSLYVVKETDKSRQQDPEEMRGQDGTVIVKAEPGDQGQNSQMMGIPSVSSMLPMAHQSAMLSNAAHSSHAMFAATMGHHGMFDTSLATPDSAELARQSYVQEALMQQILNAQKQAHQHLPHTGEDVKPFPVSMEPSAHNTSTFLQPRPAHVKGALSLKSPRTSSSPRASRVTSATVTSVKAEGDHPHKHRPGKRSHGKVHGRSGRPHLTGEILKGVRKRLFTCSHCQYASARRYNLERHIRLRHPSYRFQCPLDNCQMILLDESELRTHLQVHSDISVLRCSDCGVPCNSYDDLVQHKHFCDASSGAATQTNMPSSSCWDRGTSQTGGHEDDGEENREETEEDEVEIIDESENLPVHFLKQESPDSELQSTSEMSEDRTPNPPAPEATADNLTTESPQPTQDSPH